jgi:hypothetical protein
MLKNQLVSEIFNKQSYLCVGLDTDFDKIPAHLKSQPNALLDFNKAILKCSDLKAGILCRRPLITFHQPI